MKEAYPSKKTISIKHIIVIVFIMLMLTTVGSISYIIFSNWFSSADETFTTLAEDMNNEIFHQIDTLINVPIHINEVNYGLIENGIVDINNEYERERFFVGVLDTHQDDTVYSFSYGTENGEYYGARRNENNEIEIMRNNESTNGHSWYYSVTDDMTAGELVVQTNKFDPRTRDWYKTAKELEGPAFSPIYKHFVMDDLTVSAAHPIYKNGKLEGVMGTHITLSKIDNYLSGIVDDHNGYAVILELNSGALIANSLKLDNFITLEDGSIKRMTIEEIGNPEMIEAYKDYLDFGIKQSRISSENNKLFINLFEYKKEGLYWLVITAIPESLFMTRINNNILLTVILTIVGIILSIIIFLMIINKFLKPIDSLIEATELFSRGNLLKRANIVRNDEIGRISKAFNKMADTIYTLIYNLETKVKERTIELEVTNYALIESKNQLRLLLDSTAEAIYGIDREGYCTFCNNSCIRILGYNDQNNLIGKNMHSMIHYKNKKGEIIPDDQCQICQTLKTGIGTHVDDGVFWKADGTCFDVEYYSYPQYKDDEIIGAVITFLDNTERKKNEAHIKHLSDHDFLTNLYNRRFFEESMQSMDALENLPIAIIFGDVNGLKLTNDIFGHIAGDELLKKTAKVLKKMCREDDIVARMGGDEFAILLPKTGANGVKKIVERIKSEISEEHIMAIKCSMSLGYDIKLTLDQDIETILKNAEKTMYQEKIFAREAIDTNMIKTIIETLQDKCPYEKQHLVNVGAICKEIGKALNLSETDVKRLEEAGRLHDIGKIILDPQILNKHEQLKGEELIKFQQHATVGYRILNLFDDTLDLAESVLHHHERWDGTGYPKGLKGEEIPKMARIIGLADRYDEMIMGMFEDKPKSKDEALEVIMNQSGKQFDPEVVDVFVKIIMDRGRD